MNQQEAIEHIVHGLASRNPTLPCGCSSFGMAAVEGSYSRTITGEELPTQWRGAVRHRVLLKCDHCGKTHGGVAYDAKGCAIHV